MIQGILKLLTGSLLSRLIGLLRFQLLLLFIGYNADSDLIILGTNVIWFVNGYLILPLINRSYIKDLHVAERPRDILAAYLGTISKYGLKFMLVMGLVSLLAFVAFEFNAILWIFILIIVLLLVINELLSLYNQYHERYFLYNINTGIWNSFLIAAILAIHFLNFEVEVYFVVFFLAVLVSCATHLYFGKIQLRFSSLFKSSEQLNQSLKSFTKVDFWYLISTAFFSSFFLLNIVFAYSGKEGLTTELSLYQKIPELIYSLLTGSVFPVLFNSSIKGDLSISSVVKKLLLLNFGLLLLGLPVIYFAGDTFYSTFFNKENLDLVLLLVVLCNFLLYLFLFVFVRYNGVLDFVKQNLFLTLTAFMMKLIYLLVVEVTIYNIFYFDLAILAVLFAYIIIYFQKGENFTVKKQFN